MKKITLLLSAGLLVIAGSAMADNAKNYTVQIVNNTDKVLNFQGIVPTELTPTDKSTLNVPAACNTLYPKQSCTVSAETFKKYDAEFNSSFSISFGYPFKDGSDNCTSHYVYQTFGSSPSFNGGHTNLSIPGNNNISWVDYRQGASCIK